MSELKSFIVLYDGKFIRAYEESEVDKVIAKLKETINNSRNARKYWRKEYLIEYKEIRHHKHRRCLAMASGCEYLCAHYQFREVYKKRDFFRKWMFRWLAIAEKFKEEA